MLQEFLAQPGMPDAKTLGKILDGIRDEWIAGDLSGWLALHRFYPGVIDGLGQLLAAGHTVAIISTKEGRFIQELLHQAGVNLPSHLIFGKEVQRPKEDTLYPLVQQYPRAAVYFIEDRLAALERIKAHPHLGQVHLYLATWGYNTAADRNRAQGDARIQCLESFSCVTALLPTDN
jgi:phosphoglycolate phosphatase-like HAD superfamily hydrolase